MTEPSLGRSQRRVVPSPSGVDWIRQERWINYTRAEQVLVRLGEFLRYPPRHRMPALLLGQPVWARLASFNDFSGKTIPILTKYSALPDCLWWLCRCRPIQQYQIENSRWL